MLDLNYVRDNIDEVNEALQKRHASEEAFAQLKSFAEADTERDRKSTRLNSSHLVISYAVFCLKKKNQQSLRSYGISALRPCQNTPFPRSLVRACSNFYLSFTQLRGRLLDNGHARTESVTHSRP